MFQIIFLLCVVLIPLGAACAVEQGQSWFYK